MLFKCIPILCVLLLASCAIPPAYLGTALIISGTAMQDVTAAVIKVKELKKAEDSR